MQKGLSLMNKSFKNNIISEKVCKKKSNELSNISKLIYG